MDAHDLAVLLGEEPAEAPKGREPSAAAQAPCGGEEKAEKAAEDETVGAPNAEAADGDESSDV